MKNKWLKNKLDDCILDFDGIKYKFKIKQNSDLIGDIYISSDDIQSNLLNQIGTKLYSQGEKIKIKYKDLEKECIILSYYFYNIKFGTTAIKLNLKII